MENLGNILPFLTTQDVHKLFQAALSTLKAWKQRVQDCITGASLVAQWYRIRLPIKGTGVRALLREDPTCRGATKPVRHNY